MARIAIAWELGTALGHASGCLALARALEARGHRVALVLAELHLVGRIGGLRHELYQAPVAPVAPVSGTAPSSLADVLLGCGYDRADRLAALLAGWRSLFSHLRPDLVVADAAPTALLAARLAGLRRASFGNGFFIPPRLSPLPPFRVDPPPAQERLARADAQALSTINAVLGALGAPELPALATLFETDEDFLCTFPELDHYGTRSTSGYWGPRYSLEAGEERRWPPHEGRRVLAYLHASPAMLPVLDALIDALVASRARVAACISNLDEARRARLAGPRRIVSQRPLRLAGLLPGCDLFVGHSGDTANAALMAGVPQLLLPLHYEQLLTAVRLERLGSAVRLSAGSPPGDVGAALTRLLEDRTFAAAAQAFRRRYAAFSPEEQRRRIVARIDALVAAPASTAHAP